MLNLPRPQPGSGAPRGGVVRRGRGTNCKRSNRNGAVRRPDEAYRLERVLQDPLRSWASPVGQTLACLRGRRSDGATWSRRTIDLVPATRRNRHSHDCANNRPQRSNDGFTGAGENIQSVSGVVMIDSRANSQTASGADRKPDQRIASAVPFALQLDPADFRARQRLLVCGPVDGKRIGRRLLKVAADCPPAGKSHTDLRAGCELNEVGPPRSGRLFLGWRVPGEPRA